MIGQAPPASATLTGLTTGVPTAPGTLPEVPYQRPAPPSLQDAARYYALSEAAGQFSNDGPCVRLLGERTAAAVGVEHAIPVANCTLGLMVAMRAAFGEPAGRRRRVVIPAFTFTATGCAVRWAGFEPLFVDVDRDGWQLDAAELRRVLREQGEDVAGVLACSTFGTPASLATRAAYRDACDAAGVPLVFDSAAAFGAADDTGRPAGADGETHVFSFHVTKPFAVAEGGLVTTGDPAVADRIRALIAFGLDASRTSQVVGLNAKLSELHAAMALAMLDVYPAALAHRRELVGSVLGRLTGLPVRTQAGAEGSTWQVLQLLAPDGAARERVLAAAAAAGVQARACFDPPLHRHPAFAGCPLAGDLRNAQWVSRRAISMPMNQDLRPDEIDRIASAVATGVAG